MRDILFFAIGASIVGTIFLVSIIELIFTIRRRKIMAELNTKMVEMKEQYGQTITSITETEKELEKKEAKKIKDLRTKLDEEKTAFEKEYEEKLKDITTKNLRSVNSAKALASRMKKEAELEAGEYLAKRKKEVEQELMNLVISVSKKVLPEGISYDAQKELVKRALEEIQEKK